MIFSGAQEVRVEEAAATSAPRRLACITVFCWGEAVSLDVSFVQFVHGNSPHVGIVTAIKSKEKPILHHDIDKRFGLRSVLDRHDAFSTGATSLGATTVRWGFIANAWCRHFSRLGILRQLPL